MLQSHLFQLNITQDEVKVTNYIKGINISDCLLEIQKLPMRDYGPRAISPRGKAYKGRCLWSDTQMSDITLQPGALENKAYKGEMWGNTMWYMGDWDLSCWGSQLHRSNWRAKYWGSICCSSCFHQPDYVYHSLLCHGTLGLMTPDILPLVLAQSPCIGNICVPSSSPSWISSWETSLGWWWSCQWKYKLPWNWASQANPRLCYLLRWWPFEGQQERWMFSMFNVELSNGQPIELHTAYQQPHFVLSCVWAQLCAPCRLRPWSFCCLSIWNKPHITTTQEWCGGEK